MARKRYTAEEIMGNLRTKTTWLKKAWMVSTC